MKEGDRISRRLSCEFAVIWTLNEMRLRFSNRDGEAIQRDLWRGMWSR